MPYTGEGRLQQIQTLLWAENAHGADNKRRIGNFSGPMDGGGIKLLGLDTVVTKLYFFRWNGMSIDQMAAKRVTVHNYCIAPPVYQLQLLSRPRIVKLPMSKLA